MALTNSRKWRARLKYAGILVTLCTVFGSLFVLHYWQIRHWFLGDGRTWREDIRTGTEGITSRTKSIYLYTSFFESQTWYFSTGVGREPLIGAECPVNDCVVSRNPHYHHSFGDWDAVLFNADQLRCPLLSQYWLNFGRKPHQRFIGSFTESPLTSLFQRAAAFRGFFNWTLGYRRDMDIVSRYGLISPKRNSSDLKKFNWRNFDPERLPRDSRDAFNKPSKALWLVSHCDTMSHRERYVHELKKHMQVDIIGKCGNDSSACRSQSCLSGLMRHYKFYLSFENSVCDDYITEKVFKIMQHPVIPIVLGGCEYQDFLPEQSYINVADYKSPEVLANYLLNLTEEMYLSYFWWKEHYAVHTALLSQMDHPLCQICSRLHSDQQPAMIEDLEQHLTVNRDTGQARCQAPGSFAWSAYAGFPTTYSRCQYFKSGLCLGIIFIILLKMQKLCRFLLGYNPLLLVY